jgi:hypothetical protein
MKFLFAAIVVIALFVPAKEAQAQWTLGGGLQKLEGIGLGVGIYRNTDDIYKNTRGGGDIAFYVSDGIKVLEISANAHYFFLQKDAINAYAIVGTTGLFFSGDTVLGAVTGIVNLGAGAEYKLGFGSAYGEARYLLAGDVPLGINAGVRITL